jgi:hypothetical protein
MMKTIFFILAAVAGCVLSIFLFSVIDFPFQLPFAVDERGMWTEDGFLILGGLGTTFGVLAGWAAYAWINKPRMFEPVPSQIPLAELSEPSGRNCRPLTWRYRG